MPPLPLPPFVALDLRSSVEPHDLCCDLNSSQLPILTLYPNADAHSHHHSQDTISVSGVFQDIAAAG